MGILIILLLTVIFSGVFIRTVGKENSTAKQYGRFVQISAGIILFIAIGAMFIIALQNNAQRDLEEKIEATK